MTSSQRCWSIGGWPPTCSRSPIRSRSLPTSPKAPLRGSLGARVPSYPDEETTLAELKARIAKTVKFVEGFKPNDIDGSETRDITLIVGGQEMRFKGEPYLVHFALPNFYFHVTTAYDILRRCGVDIGKRDFIGMT